MKRLFTFAVAVILTVLSFGGCESQNTSTEVIPDGSESQSTAIEGMEIVYIYVEAFGDDWIYGNDSKVFCGSGHGYDIFNTVKVEYYKTDVVEEQGTVACNQFGDPYESTYNKIIKKVVFSRVSKPEEGEPVFDKPVIYLYPEKTTEVFVRLDFDGYFTETIPPYRDGWRVTAYPDGQLIAEDGEKYPYLFWEGVPNIELSITEGFCVAGSQTRVFLERILPKIGLSENEYTEFISYWLPRMENNEYNLIRFFGKEYTDAAKLEVTPTPDSVLRVFMVYRSSDEYIQLTEQTFTPFVREGFTVVEWGGTCID